VFSRTGSRACVQPVASRARPASNSASSTASRCSISRSSCCCSISSIACRVKSQDTFNESASRSLSPALARPRTPRGLVAPFWEHGADGYQAARPVGLPGSSDRCARGGLSRSRAGRGWAEPCPAEVSADTRVRTFRPRGAAIAPIGCRTPASVRTRRPATPKVAPRAAGPIDARSRRGLSRSLAAGGDLQDGQLGESPDAQGLVAGERRGGRRSTASAHLPHAVNRLSVHVGERSSMEVG